MEESPISEEYLNRLRGRGLLVYRMYGAEHKGYPHGCLIGKPVAIQGNSAPRGGHETFLDDFDEATGKIVPGTAVNAPVMVLGYHQEKYYVELSEGIGGRIPGDFFNQWPTIDEAIADILDYYFGDPSRMAIKQQDWEKLNRK